ncbi:MAG: FAD-dependent oxidoreductase [Alphaproteobacteria bacterium]
MINQARVVVIGGGIVGCSILYHLAKKGWTDIALIERSELTSGSSWHAAGGLFTVTGPSAVAAIHKYTYDIYPEIEAESGQSLGLHKTGGINLCRNKDEYDSNVVLMSAVRRLGIECDFISMKEAKERCPVLDTTPLHSVLWEEEGGHVDPASATQAFAAAARKLGATIVRHCPVIETNPRADGGWDVVTEQGTIHAEYLVNAAGLWGREVAALAGISLPLLPVEHHYLVTESIPEIEAMDFELPQINDNEYNVYARQEGKGMLLGAYEGKCVHWSENGTPLDFAHELLPNELERMEYNFEKAIECLPVVGTAGVKRVINGPMIFSPDLGPLIGPHPALTNYFCANGVMTGFNQGAGIGMVMAEWMVEGEPPFDIFCWDVARYGDWATPAYTKATTAYFYENRSMRIYPYQEFDVGRPIEKPPVYDRLKDANAGFGQSFGMEYPTWFAPVGTAPVDTLTFGKPNWFDTVVEECKTIRNSVGLLEFSALAKIAVEGPGAADWLDSILANRMPRKHGRVVLSPMLSPKGKLIGDLSVACLDDDKYMLFGSDVMQLSYLRHFRANPPPDTVAITNRSGDLCTLHIAGPNAPALLQKVTKDDVGTEAFPFMTAKTLDTGESRDVLAIRVSFTGEAGYELYCNPEHQVALYDCLVEAGQEFGLKPVGTRALMWSRLEKSFPAWGLELAGDYTADEAGLGRFVKTDKAVFIGRDAVIEERKKNSPKEIRVTLTVDAGDRCVWGDEAIFKGDDYIGYVTSGGYGAAVGKTIALAYIDPAANIPGDGYSVEILGERYPATLQSDILYDPSGSRMRA